MEEFPTIGSMRICDVGGSHHFWTATELEIPPDNLTLLNISTDATADLAGAQVGKLVLFDGTRIPAEEGAYDIVVSNSVLEHVQRDQRRHLVQEMLRVAPRLFLQTPAKSFPIEPHFLMPLVQWLPDQWRYHVVKVSPWRLVSRPSRASFDNYVNGTHLLSKREVRQLFPDAQIQSERFLGLVKSWYVIVNP